MKKVKSGSLNKIRRNIDSLDLRIIKLLQRRFMLVRKIAALKKEINQPIVDKKREQEIYALIESLSTEKEMNFIKAIYRQIIISCRKGQKQI